MSRQQGLATYGCAVANYEQQSGSARRLTIGRSMRAMAKSAENTIRVTVHIRDGEPFLADMDGLPGPTDTFVRLRNLFSRDKKPATWLSQNVRTIVYSAAQITFIEVHDDTESDIFVR
jgi:hypothetical protein